MTSRSCRSGVPDSVTVPRIDKSLQLFRMVSVLHPSMPETSNTYVLPSTNSKEVDATTVTYVKANGLELVTATLTVSAATGVVVDVIFSTMKLEPEP